MAGTTTAGQLVVFSIYFALAIFQLYCDFEPDDQSLKSQRQNRESNPEPLTPQELNHYTAVAPTVGQRALIVKL